MTQPFYDGLRDYYRDVAAALTGQAKAASIFANMTDIGSSREWLYADFLRLHLPTNCSVFLGGFVFDADGNESKQIDVLVTSDRALRFDFHNRTGQGKAFAAVDGCVGAASLKSYLSTAELHDALANLASIPEQTQLASQGEPRVIILGYKDWPYKIIYALDGISEETCQTGLESYYTSHPEIPEHRRVNLVHVAAKYGIVRAHHDVNWGDGTIMPQGTFGTFRTDVDVRALVTPRDPGVARTGAGGRAHRFSVRLPARSLGRPFRVVDFVRARDRVCPTFFRSAARGPHAASKLTPDRAKREARKRRASERPRVGCCEELGAGHSQFPVSYSATALTCAMF